MKNPSVVAAPLLHREGLGPGGTTGDTVLIEILDGGDIKITTDPISGPNHMSAEGLLRTIGEIAAGTTTRVRRRSSHTQHKQHQELHRRD